MIGELEARVRSPGGQNRPRMVDVSPDWLKQQLSDLAGLLKADVPRVKSEFRRLNLALSFNPVEGEPRTHYVVKGQCDLSALVFSFVQPADRGIPSAGRSGAVKYLIRGNQVHNRTPISLGFCVELPPCHLGPGWRRRQAEAVSTSRGQAKLGKQQPRDR